MSCIALPVSFDFELCQQPEAPQYFKCEQCHNPRDIDVYYALESDTCHHCQHYNGEISDAMLNGYIKIFGE